MGKGTLIGRVVGIEKITGEFDLRKEMIRQRVRSEVENLAGELLGVARSLAPHDTGELRGSLRWSGAATEKGVYAEVGSDEPVARWMEYGWTPNPHRGTKEKRHKITGKLLTQGWKKGGPKYRPNASEWTRNPRSPEDWARYGPRNIYSRPFLGKALGEMRETIRDRLRAAVEEQP